MTQTNVCAHLIQSSSFDPGIFKLVPSDRPRTTRPLTDKHPTAETRRSGGQAELLVGERGLSDAVAHKNTAALDGIAAAIA
ncbi:Hypothetical protein SMAX5B_011180 [Scophthalmus maximus]|uniref:Uncharacterized protein n=1 Tax=Scophthalmus maximus TaxID=52904 RepID=A0A2U9CRP7_SCOMX|nr:Hypothetical protein SMAX5B_011180 [Scophthalmus maximus]